MTKSARLRQYRPLCAFPVGSGPQPRAPRHFMHSELTRWAFLWINILVFATVTCPCAELLLSVGDYLLDIVRGFPWPFAASLYNCY